MLNKHTLLGLALLSTTHVFAAPIESRGLSDDSNSNGKTSPAITSNMNWELLQKNERLEEQIRELSGKIEEQDNQIEQLNKELTNRYTDLDQRLELLQQKIDPTEEDNSQESDATPATNPDADKDANKAEPAPQANTVKKPEAVAATTPTTVSSTASTDSIELEKAAYTIALDAYKQGGAKKAIAPMSNFIKNHPNSVYTGNAYFWLAEFNLAIEPPNYVEAKKNYELVAVKFPQSAKASRSLYQLYSIAKDVNHNTQSANVYKQKLLKDYPNSEEAGYLKKS